MKKRQYTYVVLRYVHDPITMEFVNVGVVAHFNAFDHQPAVLKFQMRHTIGRFRELYPNLKRKDFLTAMKAVEYSLQKISKLINSESLPLSDTNVLFHALKAVPRDDSCLQWSSVSSGITVDVNNTFDKLFHRFVSKYDEKQSHRRTDDDVWRPVHQELRSRSINLKLEPKLIQGDFDQIQFKHAWKNGAWHAYEPISLDMADEEGILRKARLWYGQLNTALAGASEDICAYFIIGKPINEDLLNAHDKAVRIIKESHDKVKIYTESEVKVLVNDIEDQYNKHIDSNYSPH